MKKRNVLIATVVALAALAAVPFLYAGGPGGGHRGFGMRMHEGMGHGGPGGFDGMALFSHLGHLKDKLNLSDAQTDQLKAIFEEVHSQNEAYREQLHGGFQDVAQTLLSNPNDLAAAQAILDRQATAEKAMKQNLLTATSKALNVLTAEQRSQLSTMLQEHAARRRERQ